jgi:hypothetical protein
VRNDVIDLATCDSALDQCPGSGNADTPTAELRSDLVADLNSPRDGRGSKATRTE